MFLTIFDVSEEMRDLFWFVRDMDEPAPTNPVLQRHANTAFKLICDSCCQLDDRAAVAGMLPAMQALGGRHIKYNVRRQHMAGGRSKWRAHGRAHTFNTTTISSLPISLPPPPAQVFRMAFLKTVGKALGSGWTEEVEGAWSRAYGKVEEMVTAGLGGR
ncbi:unnamed protein product [Closterium sp. Yama58-4]|nr:unnamed protein product [Closterium sp. Yama58-4]